MKTKLHTTIRAGLALISALGFQLSAFSQDTTFTYQGRLNDNSGPYTGSAEFQPTLWTAETSGSQVAASSPATTVVGVTNGLFLLPLDFGAAAFASGPDRWLQLEMRTTIGAFTTLTPRQKLTPTPYALQATTAAAALTASNLSGTLPATQLTGTVSDAQLSANVSLLGQTIESAEITDGTIVNADISASASIADTKLATIATAGKVADSALPTSVSLLGQSIESAEITDGTIEAADVNAGSFNTTFWGAGGNSGTTPGSHFLGTTDNQPLELKVNNSRALRLEPHATSPNVIGGYSGNFVAEGIYGATIGGGGSLDYSNAVSAPYATIDGGYNNTIQTNARFATIGGGTFNTIQTDARHATLGGGSANMIQTNSWFATVGGGTWNTIQSAADYATVGGGDHNTIQPKGNYATIPGGRLNSATNYAFAAGRRAKANHIGAFVWADSADTDFPSTSNNQFNVRASGGVRIETAGAGMTLDGQPVLSGTVTSAGIADAAVTTSKLENGAVGSAQLADNSVTTAQILDGTILNADLSASAAIADTKLATIATAGKVANSALSTSVSLLGQSIESAEITDSTIGAADVNAGSFNTTFWRAGGNSGTTAGTHFLGTTDNQPLELKVNGVRALRFEDNGDSQNDAGTTSDGAPNVIGGAPVNFVGTGIVGATISGGGAADFNGASYPQTVLSDYATVGGGFGNRVAEGSYFGTIAGGYRNDLGLNSYYGVVGGGNNNNIADNAAYATIAGGYINDVGPSSGYSAIGGGRNNNIWEASPYATIGGGYNNDIGANSDYSAISGGNNNDVADNSQYVTLPGGYRNSVGTNSFWCAIGGGSDNQVVGMAQYAAIAGGNSNQVGVLSHYGSIGGGRYNRIADGSWYATIGGGFLNAIGNNSYSTTIGGGTNNTIGNDSHNSVIAGGYRNGIDTGSAYSSIGGGGSNHIESNADVSAIAGGWGNTISDTTFYSAIGGGRYNRIVSSYSATLAGGDNNTIGPDSDFSTIGGGENNITTNWADHATIPGGYSNSATNYAFAAGSRAKAVHTGSFVWGCSSGTDTASFATRSVTFRASGGYRLYTFASGTTGASLAAGSGSWTSMSDRNAKEDVRSINPLEVLDKVTALPVATWKYKSQDASVRHIGPMAQDFKTAFDVGESDTGISTVDADGVALAAIQGLNQKVEERSEELEARSQKLEAENVELKQRLTQLEQLVHSLTQAQKGATE